MIMKRAGYIFFAVLCMTSPGCSKLDDLLTFTIEHETNIRMESATPLNLPIEIPTPDITTNSDQTFQNNNTRADLVKDIKLQKLELTITNPANRTFSFLKEVHLYISTSDSDEIELAYQTAIPTDVRTVKLIPTKEKLDKYIKASSYKLRTQIVLRETLTSAVDVKVGLQCKVTAESL